MKQKILLLFLISSTSLLAQKKMPIIKANSTTVDIKDGDNLRKGAWRISPDVKPDVYTTSNKKVTFYTDIDSITLKINPKVEKYDFMVLLNGKDSAWTQIAYQIPYLEKLQKATKYNYSDKRFIPKFEYQSKDNPNLVKIRKDLKLDSIAGEGNEISQILNLLHWVHNIVRHDAKAAQA